MFQLIYDVFKLLLKNSHLFWWLYYFCCTKIHTVNIWSLHFGSTWWGLSLISMTFETQKTVYCAMIVVHRLYERLEFTMVFIWRPLGFQAQSSSATMNIQDDAELKSFKRHNRKELSLSIYMVLLQVILALNCLQNSRK